MQISNSLVDWWLLFQGRRLTKKMIMFRRTIFICGALAILFVGSCSSVMDLIDPLTSDNRLEMDFGQNRESLSRLANIFDAYPELRSLRKDLTLGVTAIPDLPISANSVEIKGDEYRQLLDNVDALYAERGAKDGAEVIFIPVGSRYVDTDADGGGVSEEKGYAYSEHPISPVQDSLETGRKQGVTAFKSIEPGWYLYYRFSISKPE